MKFTKNTLDNLLDEVLQIYFADIGTTPIWEIVDYVKEKYKDEIDTLEEE